MAVNNELHLYYFPFSYYSQRAVLTLEEKGLKYKKIVTDMHSEETLQPSYLDMNPLGKVPVIKHGENNVPDSNAILDYLDNTFPESPQLQPDETTSEGQRVRHWRNRLNDIHVEPVTFGCITLFRDTLTKDSMFPKFVTNRMIRDIKAGRNDDKTNVMNMMEKYPKYKEIYERKLVLWDEFRKSFDSLEKVQQAIMIIDVVLDELEDELQNTKKRFSEDSDDYWLLGSNFTAADVYVAVLLNRLRFVGLHHHFESKPLITAYWKRLQSRPSFRVACLPSLYPLLFYFIGNQIKTYVPVVIGIGVIAAAVIYGRKYMK